MRAVELREARGGVPNFFSSPAARGRHICSVVGFGSRAGARAVEEACGGTESSMAAGAGEHSGVEEEEHLPPLVEEEEKLNPSITLVREEEESTVVGDRRGPHARRPDLSANIRVLFLGGTGVEYKGVYTNHGKNKTVFLLKSCKNDWPDGQVLKVARVHDPEPRMLRYLYDARSRLDGCVLGPELLYECFGHDNKKKYHCWVAERCVPLNEFAQSIHADKEKCVLGAARCIAKAAKVGLLLSDCHFFNFGVLPSANHKEHQVVIIDAGSRGIADRVFKKSEVNECMKSLWRWAQEEIEAPFDSIRELWRRNGPELEDGVKALDASWWRDPIITVEEMTTEDVEAELRSKCSRALQAFLASPQEKVIALVGASGCQGGWNAEMSAMCFKAGRALRASLSVPEAEVLAELYERLTYDTREKRRRKRSREEVEEIINFWWKLQEYRKWWLLEHDREDTEAEVLSDWEIAEVRKAWGWHEMWYELWPRQQRKGHLPSLYTAAMNNKSGWQSVAKCIIRHKMPNFFLCEQGRSASATEHAGAIGKFIQKLATWMEIFAKGLAEQHKSPSYKRARVSSGLGAERERYAYTARVGSEVLERYL